MKAMVGLMQVLFFILNNLGNETIHRSSFQKPQPTIGNECEIVVFNQQNYA